MDADSVLRVMLVCLVEKELDDADKHYAVLKERLTNGETITIRRRDWQNRARS